MPSLSLLARLLGCLLQPVSLPLLNLVGPVGRYGIGATGTYLLGTRCRGRDYEVVAADLARDFLSLIVLQARVPWVSIGKPSAVGVCFVVECQCFRCLPEVSSNQCLVYRVADCKGEQNGVAAGADGHARGLLCQGLLSCAAGGVGRWLLGFSRCLRTGVMVAPAVSDMYIMWAARARHTCYASHGPQASRVS